jgi:DNA-binding NtrC family response regulator
VYQGGQALEAPNRAHKYSWNEAVTSCVAIKDEGALMMTENAPVRLRILVIDNDDNGRGILCDRLSALGFEVAGEDNGVSGLARVVLEGEKSPFHGLVVELQMPVLGGMAVLQEMRDRFPSVPVIVMSDARYIAKLRQAMKLGAKEYLIKPFDPELVRQKCLAVFGNGQRPDRA